MPCASDVRVPAIEGFGVCFFGWFFQEGDESDFKIYRPRRVHCAVAQQASATAQA